MKTKKYHQSNLGSYAPTQVADSYGYITYHDSPRYAKASAEQLGEWASSRISVVRSAAITEQCERELAKWRSHNQ